MNDIRQEQLNHSLYSSEHEHDACGIGFLVHMKGEKSYSIVDRALTALAHMEHRGACGCEENTGDGAGVIIQVPHDFFKEECSKIDIQLPDEGQYGTGMVFLPQDPTERNEVELTLEKIISEKGQKLLGWRDVPIDDSMIGDTAKNCMPYFKQIFIGLGDNGPGLPGNTSDAFERRLYIIRKVFQNHINASDLRSKKDVYIPSLSARTFIYKGMLISYQVKGFYKDLQNTKLKSALAAYHSRFSTNTFPSWDLAQPFRYLSHNGEINTLRGNINWMKAREALLQTELLGEELDEIFPIIREGNSDSASFDNVLELLVMGGYELPQAVMMLIPEAWSGHQSMPQEKKDFYEFYSCMMEPWDGPASIAFTNGNTIGAVLDRNGLRPSRYYVTKDDVVIMGSEVGILDDIKQEDVVLKGRLQPGRMFLVDIDEGRIIDDKELKEKYAKAKPYGQWLKDELVQIDDLPEASSVPSSDLDNLIKKQLMHGYTQEDIDLLMTPMAQNAAEAIGSMGTDTPLAVLSEESPPLYSYFKQLFAQVTNPPLDAIREELVTSVDTTIGPESNLLQPTSKSAHHIKLNNPILNNSELAKLKDLATKPYQGLKSISLSASFEADTGHTGLESRLEKIFNEAAQAIKDGVNIIILSDRDVDSEKAPIPILLATAGLHHHLVREGLRSQAALVVETAEAREVHHFCLLIGYGAGAINPYLAYESFESLIREGELELDLETAIKNYQQASKKGIVKVMSKIGISTIQSYRGAQIFEAIGLNKKLIDKYFTNTASRIEGIGLEEICRETLIKHRRAYPKRVSIKPILDEGGEYKWRRNSTPHLLNPHTVAKLQHATSQNNYETYKEYASYVNSQSKHLCTLRGLMKFKKGKSIPIEDVESAESIMKRFKTGAMSYGSISAEAHETLAIAMNRIGGKSNTGEGGEDPKRWIPDANGDLRRSAIKQVASGRFGVTSEYLVNADEIQIKIAQGAKPGEGGQLPGKKVWPWVAKVRHSTPGVGLISPPPHHDIYSIEDLAQLIYDLKNSNPRAGICVKLVSEVGVGTIAAGVSKAHADLVLISGFDGGTGASPLTSLKHAGLPWELGLAETQQTLVANKLRDRIRVEVDGQLKTGRDVAIGALLGGEEYGFSTAPLVSMGCIMMRVCHLDTCPVGIATQNPELRKKFTGTADAVVNYFKFVAEELREIMAELGFRSIDEMVGRSDLLDFDEAVAHWKAKGLDFSAIFHRPSIADQVGTRKLIDQDHGLDKVIDNKLIELSQDALQNKKPVQIELPICNRDRTTGTMLGSELTRLHGAEGLPEDTIQITFNGSAGQSFGAFLPKGIRMTIVGDSNDYVGKGLSGGKIIIKPIKNPLFVPEENIIIGNVVLYGATSGEAYFRGIAGERFCVRNSGAQTVVEGVGDHACEYMTGGRVVILGKTGRNLGAGMSGGMAYVYDTDDELEDKLNKEMVELSFVSEDEDKELLKRLISNHQNYTGSTVAEKILNNFDVELHKFKKVMPVDYKKALVEIRKKMKEQGISEYEAMYGA